MNLATAICAAELLNQRGIPLPRTACGPERRRPSGREEWKPLPVHPVFFLTERTIRREQRPWRKP
jgi:hypothetical protein